jgi:hypothetical protein
MNQLTGLVQREFKGQLHWAGSQRKSTAILGSDLDMCLETTEPITKIERKQFAKLIRGELGWDAHERTHVIRINPRVEGGVKLDIAFANAIFGSRPLPNTEEFHDNSRRQQAARALKWWLRSGGLPQVPGWAIESLVIGLDGRVIQGCDLFLKIINWLARPCTANEVMSLLKPRAEPWRSEWERKLPNTLQAISNQARRLQRKKPSSFASSTDIEQWLCP